MVVATVTVVHHEQESILSKQRIEVITVIWGLNETLSSKMVVATVTVVHHEQESIPSKQRIEVITVLWGLNKT